jgi:hypothetical protein
MSSKTPHDAAKKEVHPIVTSFDPLMSRLIGNPLHEGPPPFPLSFAIGVWFMAWQGRHNKGRECKKAFG